MEIMTSLASEMKSLPSQPWVHTQEVLHSNNVHYIILCDALYGNPSDWPALLYTLTEILSASKNAEECEIINFCEQRVTDVESGFLQLLDEQNKHIYSSVMGNFNDNKCRESEEYNSNNSNESSICEDADTRSNPSPTFTCSEINKEDKLKLLNDVLAAKRAGYVWRYRVELLSENEDCHKSKNNNNNNTSELGMPIHVTHITWEKVENNTEQMHECVTQTNLISSSNINNCNKTPSKSSKRSKKNRKRARIASVQLTKSNSNEEEQHHWHNEHEKKIANTR